ncbi:hypothetical protein RB195_007416 [Necator americanus]|uniref:Uncharacterized protein n=1 Tax=Necator americanus TaxID=51031 RepID=A0ABR1BYF3_NECAM
MEMYPRDIPMATHLSKVNSRSIFEISSSFISEWHFQDLILTTSKNSDGLRRILGHKLVAVLYLVVKSFDRLDSELNRRFLALKKMIC